VWKSNLTWNAVARSIHTYPLRLAARLAGVFVTLAPYFLVECSDGNDSSHRRREFQGQDKSVFKEAGKKRPVWHEYDFKNLLEKVFDGFVIDRKIFYFAHVKEHEDSREKSKSLVEEQRLLKNHLEMLGFEVILTGRVRGQWEEGQDGKRALIFREKGVDVKIAVDMVSLSCDKKAGEIILGSSDSDLQPAIKEVRERGAQCVYLGFEAQPNKGLTFTTNRTLLIRNSEVLEFENFQKPLA